MNLNDENDIEGKKRNEEVNQMMMINNSISNSHTMSNSHSIICDHVDDTSVCEARSNSNDQDSSIDCRNILSSPLSICKNQQQHGLNRNSITLLSSAEKGKYPLLLKEQSHHHQQQEQQQLERDSRSKGNLKDEPNKFAPLRHGSPALMRPSSAIVSTSSPLLLSLGSSSTNHQSMQRTSSFRTCLKLLHLRISQPTSNDNNNSSSAKFIVPEWAGRRASGSALHIVQDSEVVNTISLDDHAYIVFGRQPQCPCNLGTCYVLDHLSVSRQHAVILHHEKDDLSYIVDLQSVHGTFVNGKKINSYDPVLLEDRNVVAFGLSPTQYIMRLFPKLSQIQDKILNEQDISETDTKTKLHTHLNCMVSYHSSPRANEIFADSSSSSSTATTTTIVNSIGNGNGHVNNNIMMQIDNDPPLFSSTNSSEETSVAGSDSVDNDSQMNEFHNSTTSLSSLTLEQYDASLTSTSSTEAKMLPPPNSGMNVGDAFTFGSPTTTNQTPVFSMKRSKSLPSMYDTFENIEKSNISFSSLAVCPTTSADSIKPRSIRSPNGFTKSNSMSRRVSFSITEPEIIPCGSDPLFSLAISSLEQHTRFKAHARSESSPALSAITPRDIFAGSFHIGEPCDDNEQGSEPVIENGLQQQQQQLAVQDGIQMCIHGKRRHISTDSPSNNIAELSSPNKRQCCS